MISLTVGLLCSILTLIPGIGVGHTLALSLLFSGEAGIFCLVSSLILNTVSEAMGFSSGNLIIDSIIARPKLSLKSLVSAKLIGWILGLIIGYLLSPYLHVMNRGIFLSAFFAAYIILSLGYIHWPILFGWFAVIGTMFELCKWIGIDNPVFVISICCFIIPMLLVPIPEEETHFGDYDHCINFPIVFFSGFLGLFTPGVSSAGISRSLSKTENVQNLACLETFQEAMGLVMLYQGVSYGKTLMASTIEVVPMTTIIVATIIVVLLSSVLIMADQKWFELIKRAIKPLNIIGLIINGGLLIYLTGFWCLIFVGLGFLSYVCALHNNSRLLSLVFIVPIL